MKYLCSSLVLAFACSLGSAQTTIPQVSSEPARLTLAVYFFAKEPPSYQPIPFSPAKPNGSWYGRFAHVRGWKQPADSPAVTAVDVKSVREADAVRVWVSVFLGELHEQQKEVAQFVIHEGEKVAVHELTAFGIEPFEFGLVRLSSSVAQLPQFASKAASVDLVSIAPVLSTMPSCQLTIRNLSTRNIVGVAINVTKGGRMLLSSMPQGKDGEPLIRAGQLYQFDQRLASPRESLPDGSAQSTVADQVVEIEAVLFEDGTYEGSQERAITYRGFLKGRKIQLQRIVELFQEAAQHDQSLPAETLESLRNAVSDLSLEADPVAIQQLIDEFGGTAGKTEKQLKMIVGTGLSGVRQEVLGEIQQFKLRNPQLDATRLQNWLSASKQHYQTWLSHL